MKRNRPMIGEAPCERVNTSLPPEVREAVRAYGSGNLSAGIRRMAAKLKLLPPKQPAP